VFLLTKSDKICLTTVQDVSSRKMKIMLEGINKVKATYEKSGFSIQSLHADTEFELLRPSLEPEIELTIYANKEHVGPIEREVRTVKERNRSTVHGFPYACMPKVMTVAMVERTVHILNSFPAANGISTTMSPATIVLGRPKYDCNVKHIAFGAAAEVYSDTESTNKERTVTAIALNETSVPGHYYFLNLATGRRLNSYIWTEITITSAIINRVEELGRKEGATVMKNNQPVFEWAPGVPIDDSFNEEVTHTQEDDTHPMENYDVHEEEDTQPMENDDDDEHIIIINDSNVAANTLETIIEEASEGTDTEDSLRDVDDNKKEELENCSTSEIDPDDSDLSYDTTIDEEDSDNEIEADDTSDEDYIETDEDSNESTSNNIAERPKRSTAGQPPERLMMCMGGKTYSNAVQFLTIQENINNVRNAAGGGHAKLPNTNNHPDFYKKAMDVMFVQQMSAKKGIKQFKERAIAAMIKEFTQLNEGSKPGNPVVAGVDPKDMTHEDRTKHTLEAVNLIQEKRSGKIKGRTCADGSKQKRYLKEGESIASPTVSLEAIMTTLVIDAYEKRDVVTFDVPGAYLHADIPDDKRLFLRLRDEFVDMMCSVNPTFTKHVIVDKKTGKKILYLKVLKAIYGCIESALLWYDLFSSTLVNLGWTINKVDRCVANKIINGHQATIAWYVDDGKLSHIDPKVNDAILDDLKQHFGDLTINRGTQHTFLGMNLRITDDRLIKIQMKEQIQEAITRFGEPVSGTASTPAGSNLFRDIEATSLSEEQSETFHSVTAKLLFVGKRARPDIDTTVAYLCTRVSKSTTYDWAKLKRLISYLAGTINMERTLGASNLTELYTYIDAAYATNPDMRSQTGGVMSMGWGVLHAKSGKQKLNTKSSTEAEVVGVSDYLPYNIQMVMFLAEQGYILMRNILYQDNQSAIKMERNGRNSCTGNSRHIHIRYFFVKDRVDKKEIGIEYCPTEQMLADFFTKPLQGKVFYLLRDIIMGIKPLSDLQLHHDILIKERVKNILPSENLSNNIVIKNPDKLENTKSVQSLTYKQALMKKKSKVFHKNAASAATLSSLVR